MKAYAPDYYKDFMCRAGECRHSCCIGWEIDIDEKTLKIYREADGELEARLRSAIRQDEDNACFNMLENGRCPFLREDGLCDMICLKGETWLADICREHPRFYNRFTDRVEVGLGLACEAAAELVLGRHEPFRLVCTGGETETLTEWESELVARRDGVIATLSEGSKGLTERINTVAEQYGIEPYARPLSEWCELFLGLDIMDDSFNSLIGDIRNLNFNEASNFLPEIITPLERLLIYFAYRHLSPAEDGEDFSARLGLVFVSFRMTSAAAVARGVKDVRGLAEIARIYSAEIEYCEENTEAIIGEFVEF